MTDSDEQRNLENDGDPAAGGKRPSESLPGPIKWLLRWGLTCLVVVAFIPAVAVAATIAVPPGPPAIALKSAAVYRIEIGVAVFAGAYLIGVAFVLALHNRGFTSIGLDGIRAQEIANSEQQDAIRGLQDQADQTKGALSAIDESIAQLQEELEEARGLSTNVNPAAKTLLISLPWPRKN